MYAFRLLPLYSDHDGKSMYHRSMPVLVRSSASNSLPSACASCHFLRIISSFTCRSLRPLRSRQAPKFVEPFPEVLPMVLSIAPTPPLPPFNPPDSTTSSTIHAPAWSCSTILLVGLRSSINCCRETLSPPTF